MEFSPIPAGLGGVGFADQGTAEEARTESIAAIEERLDAELPDRRQSRDPFGRLWLPVARLWSQVIWTNAEEEGPIALERRMRERGMELARHPVFICGAHRSGTSLVRDLLDDHPALSVLPSEGSWFTNLKPRLDALPPAARPSELGQEWLRRLANPNNQPPYWLLGRSTAPHSPYIGFARALMAWQSWLEKKGEFGSMLPHVAVALAYAHCRADRVAAPRMWVDKTPANERFIGALRKEFPTARIIHVIRRPEAVLASVREMAGKSAARILPSTLRNLALSYRIALAHREAGGPGSYLLLRYEDLTRDPAAEIDRLRNFLGIEAAPILLRPTVAGRPATNNSAFPAAAAVPSTIVLGAPARNATLGRLDRLRLAAAVGQLAPGLGYPMGPRPFGTAFVAWLQRLFWRVRTAKPWGR